VVGVVRVASLSTRSKALLTRAPSSGAPATPLATRFQHTVLSEVQSPTKATVNPLELQTKDPSLRQGVHAHLSKTPSPIFTASTASSYSSTPSPLKSSPFPRRTELAHELGSFPAIVGEVDNRFVLAHGVDRTGRGIKPLEVRGGGTRMDQGSKDEMRPNVQFYNEKDLPRVPYAESRERAVHSRPLPLLPTVSPPALHSHAHVQSQPAHMSGQVRRQESFGSNTLTRVSSLLSRLSNSTLPTTLSRQSTRRSKRGTILPPPLPPPPLPLPLTPGQMQLPGLGLERHPEEATAGHELMERSGTLGRMVPFLRQSCDRHRNQKAPPAPDPLPDEIHLGHQLMPPEHAHRSNGSGYVHKNVLSQASSIRSMFSNRSDRSRHQIPKPVILGINTPMVGDGSARFMELNDDEKRQRHWSVHALGVDHRQPWESGSGLDVGCLDVRGRNARGPAQNRKRWTGRSKWIAVALFSLALIGLVVGLVIILARRNTDNQASTPSCTESKATGRFCDLSTYYCAPLYSVGTNSLNRQDVCLHHQRARPL
jgi:hypothetical protein